MFTNYINEFEVEGQILLQWNTRMIKCSLWGERYYRVFMSPPTPSPEHCKLAYYNMKMSIPLQQIDNFLRSLLPFFHLNYFIQMFVCATPPTFSMGIPQICACLFITKCRLTYYFNNFIRQELLPFWHGILVDSCLSNIWERTNFLDCN